MKVERVECLKVNCPELFEDKDFADWLENRTGDGLATWHQCGTEPGEYSDVFVTFDHGEGSDGGSDGHPNDPGMPLRCWERLVEIANQHGMEYGILWLTNLAE